MKLKNPFRTKLLIIAMPEYSYVIKVPFFRKSTIEKRKVKMKGYEASYITIDEAGKI